MTNLVQLRQAYNLLYLGRLDPILLLRKVILNLISSSLLFYDDTVMSLRILLIRLMLCFLSTGALGYIHRIRVGDELCLDNQDSLLDLKQSH
jgi:hypothetical protein